MEKAGVDTVCAILEADTLPPALGNQGDTATATVLLCVGAYWNYIKTYSPPQTQ